MMYFEYRISCYRHSNNCDPTRYYSLRQWCDMVVIHNSTLRLDMVTIVPLLIVFNDLGGKRAENKAETIVAKGQSSFDSSNVILVPLCGQRYFCV